VSTGRRVPAGVVLALASLAAAAPGAAASAVTGDELDRLARRAGSDPAALRRLRAVDRVDGRAVDLARALRGARGADLDARLGALQGVGEAGADAARGRAAARTILSARRFQPAPVPRPFREPLRRAGAALNAAWDWVAERAPGGEATVWAALGAMIVALAAAFAARVARRRERGAPTRGERDALREVETAPELERRADAAEAAGERARALRLRFRAGLLRLDSTGAIALRPSLTAGEISRGLRSPTFDALARDLDEVLYGGRPADLGKIETARAGWPRVVAEARER
jgi:hypothetical protein